MRELGRWFVAVVAMVAVAVLSVLLAVEQVRGIFELDEDPAAAADPPAVATAAPEPSPVTSGAAPASADLAVSAGAADEVDERSLTVRGEPGDAALFQFPLIPGDPACVEEVVLEVEVQEATPTELGAYPAVVTDLTDIDDGEALPQPLLRTQEPRGLAFTDGSPGRLRWDVTDMYRTWVTGQPFDADNDGVPADAPLVIAVTPTSVEPDQYVVFVASEVGQGGPVLLWRGVERCGAEPDA